MNKTHWITVVLDGSVPQEFINRLVAKSYMLTRGKRL
jgi:predicted DNA-binding protein (MmcQ/YjbR family)